MKKLLLALAVLATSVSYAQSNVNISGSVEYAAKRSVAGVTSYGGTKSDRNQITFSGSEDLGSGLSANFLLQNRFAIDTGLASQTSSTDSAKSVAFEQSALGLTSNQFGSVKLGRFTNQLSLGEKWHFQEDSPYGANFGTQYARMSGQFQYTTPKFYGLSYTFLSADGAANRYVSFVSGNGTLTTTDLGTSLADLNAHIVTFEQGPVYAQYAQTTGLKGEAAERFGATYNLGNGLKLGAGQFNQKEVMNTQYVHRNNFVGAEYTVGNWVTALTHTRASAPLSSTVGQAEKTGVKAYYSLSKRTTLQAEAVKITKSSTSTDGTSYAVGIRHTF